MKYDQLCAELAGLEESIVATFVLSDKVAGMHVKMNVPKIKEEDAQLLADQTATVIGITRTNERLFGKVGFLLVHHEFVDGIFFPVDDDITVLIGLVQPYDQAKVVEKVCKKIGSAFPQ
ncbi:hypothetical protein [Nitrososphaera viennensis]|uniref:Roadblock/LAMTOR2 domain-containing protein n=2 Tax=Nitrososphaera viennensis TaxID=1034015 RepID=A0A060HMX1_9ARCH|nr:hypothetical protein [Nitrososphaera viennensis]AIC14552.1 hypothetical protein NVIE_003600 [Nitrososphaera viennensis EN76]UVS69522.1 hypothetical protein NWT39_01750 [Nitrososphaera viennensis]